MFTKNRHGNQILILKVSYNTSILEINDVSVCQENKLFTLVQSATPDQKSFLAVRSVLIKMPCVQ